MSDPEKHDDTLGPRSTMRTKWPMVPIAGGAQDDPPPDDGDDPPSDPPVSSEPPASPAAPDVAAELKAIREGTDKQNALLGQILEENARLRAGGDAARLRGEGYRPTIGAPADRADNREDAAAQLEKVITEGMDDAERMAPTGRTFAKMLLKAAPVLGEFVDDRLAQHEYRRQLDGDFWDALAADPKWGGKTPRELQKRHGKRVAALSQELMIDPKTGKTKAEYLNDPDKAMLTLKDTYEKELNMIAEDAPTHPRPRSRAATGDHGSARVQTARRPESQEEFDKTVTSVLEPATSRRR